jgi:hypothetical protein
LVRICHRYAENEALSLLSDSLSLSAVAFFLFVLELFFAAPFVVPFAELFLVVVLFAAFVFFFALFFVFAVLLFCFFAGGQSDLSLLRLAFFFLTTFSLCFT